MELEAPPRIRPGWVWAIFLFCSVAFVWSALAQVAILLDMLPGVGAQQAYLHRLTSADFIVGFGLNALHLAAAVLLWLLRKEAFPLFVAGFVFGVFSFVWQVSQRGLLDQFRALGVIGTVVGLASVTVGWGISVAICVYVWKLRERGLLQ